MRSGPIRHVVVAGGGIVGWSVAAALRKGIPAIGVTVLPLPPPTDALADRLPGTLPSVRGFHETLGLSEADTVVRAGSGFRLGSLFEGWSDRAAYVHSYGAHGAPLGTASFHQHWIRAALRGETEPFDAYAPAALLARAGRFTHPAEEPGLLGSFDFGLTLTPASYRDLLKAYALHLGAVERRGELREVRLGEDGFIETLLLNDGTALAGDLFVDASGPRALLRGALGLGLEEWGRWLPCDRIAYRETPPAPEPPVLDVVAAAPAGWHWRASSPRVGSEGYVFSAAEGKGGPSDALQLTQGRVSQPWLRNCVAIGDAAVRVEPLEWTNLHLAHSAIARLVAMMPDRAFNPVELWDYNRQTAAETDRVRDFIILHYAASNRPEPFWQSAAAAEPPESLAHTLSLFRERGRLPFYEGETFSRDSWLAVLLGQGLLPSRSDPLLDAVPQGESDAAMAQMRAAAKGVVPTVPVHGTYLQSLIRQALG